MAWWRKKPFQMFFLSSHPLHFPSWRTMPPRGRTTSPWWTHFQAVEGCTYLKDSFYSESLGDFRLAKCLHCDKLVRRGKPGCTARETTNSGMASHMRTKHSGLALQVMLFFDFFGYLLNFATWVLFWVLFQRKVWENESDGSFLNLK